jgi:hypothetical protein
MAWLLQRLEWAVDNLFNRDKDGVLVLSIDPQKDVVLSLDELRAPPRLTSDNLVAEGDLVTGAQHEGAPLEGSVWSERNGVLYVSAEELVTATGTLARDLAQTLGLPLKLQPQTPAELAAASTVFLISDEFGFIPLKVPLKTPSSSAIQTAPATARLEQCFASLFAFPPSLDKDD